MIIIIHYICNYLIKMIKKVRNKLELLKMMFKLIDLINPFTLEIREQEIDVLCLMFILNKTKSYKLESREMVTTITSLLKLSSRQTVYNMRYNLKIKGWLVQTTDGLMFSDQFPFKTLPSNSVKFKCTIEVDDK